MITKDPDAVRHLRVNLKMAIQHAVSSKSYWHMARTPAVQMAMSNASQGWVSLRELWLKAQGYAV